MFLFSKDQIYSNPYEQIPDNEDISERDRLEFGHMEINQSTSTSQSPSDYNHQHQQAMNSNSSSSRIKGYLNSSTYNQNRYCTKFILLLIAIPSLVTIIYSRYFAGILLQTTLSKTTTFKPVTHPESPTALWGVVTKPYPTGAFWTNLAVRGGDSPIAVLPYGIKTVDAGIQVSYGATRRSVSQIAISDPFVTDLQISATQGYVSRSIEAYDNVSVTMGYHTQQNGKYKTHLVKGSPYITVVYDGATPVISSSLMRILTVESRVVKNNMGVQYIVTLGNFQKWLVYCSEPVALSWKEDTLTSPQPIKGIIRVAFLPLQTLESSFSILVNYIQRYPTGATMAITHPTATSSLVTFSYSSVGIGSLLMLALTHHVQAMGGPSILTNETRVAQIAYYPVYCSKGRMKAVVGDVWKLIYNMPQIGWNYVLSEAIPLPKLDEIGRNLILDVKTNLPNAPDVYSFGKQLARMARLAVLADSLGIAEARQQAISIVETSILPWLQGLNQNPLLYERTYGGVITTNGFNDPNSDFGNGYYNDHHFHYGYMIYAAAVISRFDAAFYDANRNQLDTIVRDICNPDATDSDFPFARHKDFYDGHSWASGLFPQANGKGQESSSEAANAYYACYLYGLATNNPTLMQFSHTLLSMEVQATQLYWHMSNSDTYDPVFATGRMVGNVGGLDVTASTWFGSQLEFVHGINILPVTPLTAILFDNSYVQRQWPVLGSRLPVNTPVPIPECSAHPPCVALSLTGLCCPNSDGVSLACCGTSLSNGIADEWKSFIYTIHALVNRDAAWSEISKLEGFGVGGSKTNSLFWAASRPPALSGYNASTHNPDYLSSIRPVCAQNSACDAAGLSGKCCPSDNPPGVFLGCCPQIVTQA